jgi:hypothetical protein
VEGLLKMEKQFSMFSSDPMPKNRYLEERLALIVPA